MKLPGHKRTRQSRGLWLRIMLAEFFPDVTWEWKFDTSHDSHVLRGVFPILNGTFQFSMSLDNETVSEMDLEKEIIPRIAQAMAHAITSYILDEKVNWQSL